MSRNFCKYKTIYNYEVCGQAQPSSESSTKPMQTLRLFETFKTKLTRTDPAIKIIFHREIIFKPKQQMGGKVRTGDMNAIIFILAEVDLLLLSLGTGLGQVWMFCV